VPVLAPGPSSGLPATGLRVWWAWLQCLAAAAHSRARVHACSNVHTVLSLDCEGKQASIRWSSSTMRTNTHAHTCTRPHDTYAIHTTQRSRCADYVQRALARLASALVIHHCQQFLAARCGAVLGCHGAWCCAWPLPGSAEPAATCAPAAAVAVAACASRGCRWMPCRDCACNRMPLALCTVCHGGHAPCTVHHAPSTMHHAPCTMHRVPLRPRTGA